MRAKQVVTTGGKHYGHSFHCPGCDEEHIITTEPYPNGWTWNGSLDRPTFTPSIHVYPSKKWVDGVVVETPRCHRHVADGRIQFLNDSTHALAGKTVDLPELASEPPDA